MKKCPYCAEDIQDAAIKCRYCHTMLGPEPDLSGQPDSGESQHQQPGEAAADGTVDTSPPAEPEQPSASRAMQWLRGVAFVAALLALLWIGNSVTRRPEVTHDLPDARPGVSRTDPNDPEAVGAFREALVRGDVEAVRRWLDAGLGPDTVLNPESPCGAALSTAASQGDPEIVTLLLERGGNVDVVTGPERRTPLMCAADAVSDLPGVIRMLLDHKADINRGDRAGLTPLMLAATRGHDKAVALLLERRANKNARSRSGETAIELAARSGHEATFDLLKRSGAAAPARLRVLKVEPTDVVGGLTSVVTTEGMILRGETWDQALPKLQTGTRLELRRETADRFVDVRRLNRATYLFTFERPAEPALGPYRLVRIDIE